MEYTKGEWTVRSGFKVTVGAEQTWVADCYPFHEKHPRPRVIEAEANARLIASAPKLYEACKVVKDVLENNQNNGREALQLAIKASLFITNKALAEAEGK